MAELTSLDGIIKAAVIKANTKSDYSDHYKIFSKLEVNNNPINLYNYRFENPSSQKNGILKSDSSYWTVDLDSITHEEIKAFDFLVLVVNSNTNIYSYIPKIKSFTDNGGCLFIEVEGEISDSVKSILPVAPGQLTSGTATSLTYNLVNDSDYSDLNLFDKNQSWDINSGEFDSGYGIYGKINQSVTAFSAAYSNYKCAETNIGPIVVQFKTNVNDSGSVSCGNIILNTVSINKKAGADYLPGTDTSASDTSSRILTLTSDAEGPLKYFYNSILVGIISKYYTTSNSSNSFSTNILTPVLFHATAWNTSWTINGPTTEDNYSYNDILIKNQYMDEYSEYGFVKEQNNDIYRKLNDKTVEQIFIEDFSSSVPSSYGQFYNTNDSITYYIEFTNSSIVPKNGTYLENSISTGITTPYKTYALDSNAQKQTIYAKTTTISRPLNVPANFGTFYIKDRFRDVKNIRLNQPNIVNDNPYFYSYDFKTSWRKVVSTESSLSFDMSFDINFTLQVPVTIQIWEKKWEQVGTMPLEDPSPIDRQLKFEDGEYSELSVTSSVPLNKIGKKITNKYFCREDFIDYTSSHNPNAADKTFNHYPYTGDIDLGNTAKQYSVGPRSGDVNTGEYVHYIQWTLKQDGYNVSTDGVLGPQTGSALTSFQSKYGLATVDQQVDSETKSAMAYFWATKKQKNQLTSAKSAIRTFYNNQNKKTIGDKVIAYIDAAIDSADPISVTKTGSIKRISYTGSVKTPSTIKSNIFIALPAQVYGRTQNDEVYNIKIKTGVCGVVIENIKFYQTETNESNLSRFPAQGGLDRLSGNTIDIPANTEREISIAFSSNAYKILCLTVTGKKLPSNYGTGQGIFIDYITVNYLPDPGEPQPKYDWRTYESGSIDVTAYIDVKAEKIVKDLTVSNTPKLETITSANFTALPMIVKDFYYFDSNNNVNKFTYSSGSSNKIEVGTSLSINSVYDLTIENGVTDQWGTLKVNLAEASVVPSAVVSVTNKKVGPNGGTKTIDNQYINYIDLDIKDPNKDINGTTQITLGYDVNVTSLSSEVSYGGQTVVPEHRHLYVSFLTKDQPKIEKVSAVNKNKIDYLSGIVCLCDDKGNPVGKPNFAISSDNNDTVSVNITNIYLESTLNTTTDGLVYGFFDLSARQFLGKNISYSEYLERNGENNIYIAVMATDYDGNILSDDIDFRGFSTIPVSTARVPNKVICPVYNVKFKNKASIEVFKPQNFLDKKSPWYVGLSSGSFVRSISINTNNIYNENISWIKKYSTSSSPNAAVNAFYDTTQYTSSGWSNILGRPYYDIHEEKPILIDSKTIRLRQTPFAVVHEPSNDLRYFGSPIKPFVFVYVRESISESWSLIQYSDILSFDSNTGIIQFKNPIVPTNYNLIKVNYSVYSSYRPIKVIGSKDLNLNPYLEKQMVKFNKPMFFYLEPNKVEIVGQFEKQKAYEEIVENENVLNYTEDATMFDPSHPKYNPLAVLLCTIYIVDNDVMESFGLNDLRLKGGGINYNKDSIEVFRDMPRARSFWDMSGPDGYAYTNGGYVVIQLPSALKQYLGNDKIKEVISSALTAGVVYEIQDYDGNSWEDA